MQEVTLRLCHTYLVIVHFANQQNFPFWLQSAVLTNKGKCKRPLATSLHKQLWPHQIETDGFVTEVAGWILDSKSRNVKFFQHKSDGQINFPWVRPGPSLSGLLPSIFVEEVVITTRVNSPPQWASIHHCAHPGWCPALHAIVVINNCLEIKFC